MKKTPTGSARRVQIWPVEAPASSPWPSVGDRVVLLDRQRRRVDVVTASREGLYYGHVVARSPVAHGHSWMWLADRVVPVHTYAIGEGMARARARMQRFRAWLRAGGWDGEARAHGYSGGALHVRPAVGSFHVDTPEALAALAAFLRQQDPRPPKGWILVGPATLERRGHGHPCQIERVDANHNRLSARAWLSNGEGVIQRYDPPLEPVRWLTALLPMPKLEPEPDPTPSTWLPPESRRTRPWQTVEGDDEGEGTPAAVDVETDDGGNTDTQPLGGTGPARRSRAFEEPIERLLRRVGDEMRAEQASEPLSADDLAMLERIKAAVRRELGGWS